MISIKQQLATLKLDKANSHQTCIKLVNERKAVMNEWNKLAKKSLELGEQEVQLKFELQQLIELNKKEEGEYSTIQINLIKLSSIVGCLIGGVSAALIKVVFTNQPKVIIGTGIVSGLFGAILIYTSDEQFKTKSNRLQQIRGARVTQERKLSEFKQIVKESTAKIELCYQNEDHYSTKLHTHEQQNIKLDQSVLNAIEQAIALLNAN